MILIDQEAIHVKKWNAKKWKNSHIKKNHLKKWNVKGENQNVVWAMKANEVECVEIDGSINFAHAMKWRKTQM